MSFSTTTPSGKKSVQNVEPFMTAGPEYQRNWVGTIISIIFGWHFLPNAILRIRYLVNIFHGDQPHDWSFYLTLAITVLLILLNLAILVVYYKALVNPRYLHGVDSVDNLKPYKYYILVLFAIFLLDLIVDIGNN